MNKLFDLRKGLLILIFLLISAISLAKVRISGNLNVWFDTTSQTSNSKKGKVKNVGNIDDKQFEEKPFVINGTGYAFLRNNEGDKLLLKVNFDNNGNVINEQLFYTYRFTINCISVYGDDSKCITLTDAGLPAVWDRFQSKYIYYGKFINGIKIRNPFKTRNYYDNNSYFDPLFEF